MKQIINIDTWKRKEYYLFFKDYQEPFFGVTANVDCTKAYNYAKENNLSFFLYYMYKSLQVVNTIDEFRYRIEEDNIVCYDQIHGSTTAPNANDLFAFAFLYYTTNFEEYYVKAQQEIAKIKTISDMNLDENSGRADVIHYTTLPWISFTSLTHERNFAKADSIPKIAFGKYFMQDNRLLLPLAIHVHHGLTDGMHVGKYFDLFQQLLNEM